MTNFYIFIESKENGCKRKGKTKLNVRTVNKADSDEKCYW
jgi:hypothetical protein